MKNGATIHDVKHGIVKENASLFRKTTVCKGKCQFVKEEAMKFEMKYSRIKR